MAFYRSFNLKDVAESVGLTLADYMIACYYCQRWLTVHEKLLYVHAELLVVWKEDCPYACCQYCIRTGAKVDFLTGFSRSIAASRFGEICSDSWEDIILRCLVCLRKLTAVEKGDIQANNSTIFLIKNGFRAPCALCRLGL